MAAEFGNMQPGQSIERWLIEKKLGEGACGAVYKVKDPTGQYALKVEALSAEMQVLKMEVFVLSELTKKGSRHFCKIEDKGRFGSFNFVVMTLVGKSLQDLRKERPAQNLSLACSISCGIQCLEALEDLHGIGYLHRDVKPGNYTIGRKELNEERKIYILDFGMCRKFTNDQGIIRKPRNAAGFRGTVRYAPIACHLQQDLCRKDDLETWVYQQVELTVGRVAWKEVQDIKAVGEFKKRCRVEPGLSQLFCPPCPPEFRLVGEFKKRCRVEPGLSQLFCPPCPPEFRECLKIIDNTKYFDEPNYQALYALMRTALQKTGLPEFPYDWEK